ncbi:MAG TPA: diaminopimelate epimerase [Thermoanaerobaculia bacterium]|nr:diaminopimelate epimerase [Thermoanaerobaculia bacterium]
MQFFKLSGAGNDFLALVEPEAPPTAIEIAAWCRRGLSVGADGLFVLARRAGGAVGMDYYNADGLPAALCLNGTRCAARLALELGWQQDRVRIVTGAGEVLAERVAGSADDIALDAPLPAEHPIRERLEFALATGGRRVVEGHRVTIGVPHFVIAAQEGLSAAPVAELGPPVRHHPAFSPAGTNVHFVSYRDGGFDIRSWERGVEAETLACGSGVLAATAVGLALGRSKLPVTAHTRGGFLLRVEGTTSGDRPDRWRLTGEARLVARGELLPGAIASAVETRW